MKSIALIFSLVSLLFSSLTLYAGWPWPTANPLYFPKHFEVKEIPEWMERRIQEDLAYYHTSLISISNINKYFDHASSCFQLIKVTISNNKVFFEKQFPDDARTERYRDAFEFLCKTVGLPNTTFLLGTADCGKSREYPIPIFFMAKERHWHSHILIPDFDAIAACYQVLEKEDITKYVVPWKSKKEKLFWRGGSVQGKEEITRENYPSIGRFILCDLSLKYPHLINAKFTLWGHEHLLRMPEIEKYGEKPWPSYEEQLQYKYQILVDGISCAYTASGWKWFTNSLLFKPDSQNIQWYYPELIPNVHYIPVRADLADLLEKIDWAKSHDDEVKAIAENARKFALEHITIESNLLYLHQLISKYTELLHEGEV